MKKIVLTFGLIAGSIISALMALSFTLKDQLGYDNGMVIGYTIMVASLLMVYFGIRSYRDTVLDGRIRFWPAVKVGLLISSIAVACYVATWEVMYFQFMPNYMRDYAAHEIDKARQAGSSPAELAKQQQDMDAFLVEYQKPLVNIGYTILEPLPIVLLVTVVSAGLLSRKRDDTALSTEGSRTS